MKKDINSVIISPRDSIKTAMELIDKIGFRCALVADEKMRLLGIITDGDIRKHILKDINLNLCVRLIMNTRPITLKQNYSLGVARDIMIKNGVTLIPIVSDDGVITDYLYLSDILMELEKNGAYRKNNKRAHEIKKVLVIGGAGYIGSLLVRKLLAGGYKVRVMDILLYGDESIKELYEYEGFEFLHGDCRNMENVICALDGQDAVVHLGEIVGDPACSLNPDFTIEVNYMATKALAEACCYQGINKFIFSSSCSVYGVSDNELDEKSLLNPVSLYAKCKIESEKAILSIRDSNFNPVVLRLATVYGLSHRPRFDLVVNLLTAKAIREKKVKIFGGNQWRPFVSVNDVSDVIIKALQSQDKVVGRQIFNVGSNSQNYQLYQIGDMVKKIAPEADLEIEKQSVDKRSYKVNFTKINGMLGFECKNQVLDEMAVMRDYILKNQNFNFNDSRFNNYNTLVAV